MDLRSIYVSNCIGVVLLLILYYTSRTKISGWRMEDRLHSFMVFGVMLGCVMEMFSYTIDGKLFPGARALNYLANTYLYTANLLLPFGMLVYVDLGLYGDLSRIRRKYRLQIAVGLVMLAANVLNFFVPITYVISQQNIYERRPFSYVYYLVILYYCVTAILLTRRYEKENGAKTFVKIYMFLIPILLGTGLQFLFYGLSLAWLSSAVGLVGLFMMQQNEMAYLDALTDTYNRQYLNRILSAWIRRGSAFVGAMIDIDDFKEINDSCGHSEGDNALKAVAAILKRSQSEHDRVFRFAGDEFIVLKMTNDPDGLDPYMEEVDRRLKAYNDEGHPYRLALSYGTRFWTGGSVDDFMKELDDKMYEMKAVHHAGGAAPESIE